MQKKCSMGPFLSIITDFTYNAFFSLFSVLKSRMVVFISAVSYLLRRILTIVRAGVAKIP